MITLLMLGVFNLFSAPSRQGVVSQIAYSDFKDRVATDKVKSVTIERSRIVALTDSSEKFETYIPLIGDPTLMPLLEKHRVQIVAAPPRDESTSLWSILLSWFPMLLLIGVWIYFMRQMQGGGKGGIGGFGKSRARLLTPHEGRVTFEDVAGVDEAKQELQEVIEFLQNPRKFHELGAKIPKGVLLVGPPGTGKTLLARAVAGEANVPFFSISGSDFVEMFVGVGAARVRDLFEQGKKNAPCIIFMDEIDAMGRHRGAGLGGGNDEREQTLNQLLVEMDGFESNRGVILIAATNRPDVLDPALVRPGRFDRQVVVSNPDLLGREQILKVHMKRVPLAPDVNAKIIARGTPGFSGADLANLVNEAALHAARKNRRVVTMEDFEAAKDKVLMGPERKSMVMSESEKKLTAYHEAGHAVVTLHVPKSDPLHKVTIIPRGRALGLTMSLPEADRHSFSYTQLCSRLAILYGGRIAEELMFGKEDITTGASNDIEQATELARRMVTEFGFSDKVGRIRVNASERELFLGKSITERKNVSEEMATLIDQEIKRFIEEAENKARSILTEYRNELDMIANALLEHETLSGEDIEKLLRGETLNREKPESDTPPPRPRSPIPSAVPQTIDPNKDKKNPVDDGW